MNNKQVDFIICANNALYYNECVRYINDLDIPEGYAIDVLCVQDVNSIAEGYNAGMQASEAKYKVYLRQDTFILNREFIYDIIKIFESDGSIGMLGVLGTDSLPADAACHSKWNVGCADIYDGRINSCTGGFLMKEETYVKVAAIDGCIMVTQQDVPWREDFLDGWDFYDVSQSIEMQKQGYQIVVPCQEKPWCYCDHGINNTDEYDKYRKKMLQEYPEFFERDIDEAECLERAQDISQWVNIRRNLIQFIESGQFKALEEITEELRSIWPVDIQIREITNLMEIYALEESIGEKHSLLFQCYNWEEVYEYYKWIQFVLMRFENGREDDRIVDLLLSMEADEISRDAIRKISYNSLSCTTRIFERFLQVKQELPLVSVIVSVYNGADTIGDTLDSILNQTYQNIEVIVVDDASTDNSRDIISTYKDARIKTFFLEKNRHICYAGNVGFRMATGKYVALIGHDDIWKADKLEKQVAFLETHPSYAVCFSWVDIIDEDKNIVNDVWSWLYNRFCGDNYSRYYWMRRLTRTGNYFCAPSACIRREFLEKTGGYRYGLVQLQDFDLWLRLLREGAVYILQEKLVLYRRFVKSERNLSSNSLQTQNRDSHEGQWIQDTFLNELSAEEFVQIFKKDLKNQRACDEKEILCEKIFLLREMRNAYFSKRCIDLLEDEECRDILEEKYHFKLTDFYKMNAEPIVFDNTLLDKIREQERLIESYQKC